MKRGSWLAFTLAVVVTVATGCGGGGSTPAGNGSLTDAALFAKAVQDYNGKAYATAQGEFQELLNRATATAYHDKSTIYIAAIDFYRGLPASCLAVLGSPTAPTTGFFKSYPASLEVDRARYWHGRCELGVTPPDYLVAREDFTAVVNMAGTTYADNAYQWRGRTWYATALAADENSGDWASALSDFGAVISNFGNGTVAPEAQYWIGRTHFARADVAKGRGTVTGDTLAQSELAKADTELKKQLSTYAPPGNTLVPDVSVYLGRTHFEQASYAANPVAAYTVAVSDLAPLLGTTALVRDEANYWYGRALHELGLAHETAVPPDLAAAKVRLDEATTQLRKFQTDATLTTSTLADNASYWVGRCLYSLGDLLKVQATASASATDWASTQTAFATAWTQFNTTKTSAQFRTSNLLDWVQVYLARSKYEQGVAAQAQGTSAVALYAGAQAAFADYFTLFASPVQASAAAAHYWYGRTYHAQANLPSAIVQYDQVVQGWDYLGIGSTTKPTTTWWDNAQDQLIHAYSDQAAGACSSAQASYDALKTAIPTDSLLGPACTYMKDPVRCPANTCP